MRSPELGLATIVGLNHPLEDVLDVAEAVEVDGVEITGRPPHLTLDATAEELEAVRRATRSRGLAVLAYGSYLGFRDNFGPKHVEAAVTAARALGAARLRVWAESPTGKLDERGLSEVVALLQTCCDQAANHDISVVVERHRDSFADSVDRVEGLLKAVDRANLALNYQPLDHLPVTASSQLPNDARRLAPHARYFHLKNYRVSDAPSPTLELGASVERGALDYQQILASAFQAGYSGPLVLEFVEDDDSKTLEERVRTDLDFIRRALTQL